MRIIVLFVFFSILNLSCSNTNRNLTGQWVWDYNSHLDEHHRVVMTLVEDKEGHLTGTYCSEYGSGATKDCSEEKTINNFDLQRQYPRSYKGSFRSNDLNSNEQGEIEMKYSNKFDGIFVNILKEPDAPFLFPDEVLFLRKN